MHLKSLHQQDKFPNATLQIGDGDHLAVTTQCITVSDFRQKHLAGGGEGAEAEAARRTARWSGLSGASDRHCGYGPDRWSK